MYWFCWKRKNSWLEKTKSNLLRVREAENWYIKKSVVKNVHVCKRLTFLKTYQNLWWLYHQAGWAWQDPGRSLTLPQSSSGWRIKVRAIPESLEMLLVALGRLHRHPSYILHQSHLWAHSNGKDSNDPEQKRRKNDRKWRWVGENDRLVVYCGWTEPTRKRHEPC